MSGLFAGTRFERPVTCDICEKPLSECKCPRDAKGNVLLPKHQTALIRLEKRGKGKTVTLVTGLDASATDLPDVLKTLKLRCATGGAASPDGIELQGDHREAARKFLAESGYRTKVR